MMTDFGECVDPDQCETCNRSAEWHLENQPRHPFKHNEMPVENIFSKKKRPAQPGPSVPFDPILRQALLDKGILTAEDIQAAQAKMIAILGQNQSIKSRRNGMADSRASEYGGRPGLIQPSPHDVADHPQEMLRLIYANDPAPDVIPPNRPTATPPDELKRKDWPPIPPTQQISS